MHTKWIVGGWGAAGWGLECRRRRARLLGRKLPGAVMGCSAGQETKALTQAKSVWPACIPVARPKCTRTAPSPHAPSRRCPPPHPRPGPAGSLTTRTSSPSPWPAPPPAARSAPAPAPAACGAPACMHAGSFAQAQTRLLLRLQGPRADTNTHTPAHHGRCRPRPPARVRPHTHAHPSPRTVPPDPAMHFAPMGRGHSTRPSARLPWRTPRRRPGAA